MRTKKFCKEKMFNITQMEGEFNFERKRTPWDHFAT